MARSCSTSQGSKRMVFIQRRRYIILEGLLLCRKLSSFHGVFSTPMFSLTESIWLNFNTKTTNITQYLYSDMSEEPILTKTREFTSMVSETSTFWTSKKWRTHVQLNSRKRSSRSRLNIRQRKMVLLWKRARREILMTRREFSMLHTPTLDLWISRKPQDISAFLIKMSFSQELTRRIKLDSVMVLEV